MIGASKMMVFLLFLGSVLAIENIRFGDSILGGYTSSVVIIDTLIFKPHLHSHPQALSSGKPSILFVLVNI